MTKEYVINDDSLTEEADDNASEVIRVGLEGRSLEEAVYHIAELAVAKGISTEIRIGSECDLTHFQVDGLAAADTDPKIIADNLLSSFSAY